MSLIVCLFTARVAVPEASADGRASALSLARSGQLGVQLGCPLCEALRLHERDIAPDAQHLVLLLAAEQRCLRPTGLLAGSLCALLVFAQTAAQRAWLGRMHLRGLVQGTQHVLVPSCLLPRHVQWSSVVVRDRHRLREQSQLHR